MWLKKFKAMTMIEFTVIMVVIGALALLCVPIIKIVTPKDSGWVTLSQKMAEHLETAASFILINNTSTDSFLRIKDGDNRYFSIEDADATPRMSALFRNNLSDIAMGVNTNRDYFKEYLKNYDDTSTGEKIGDIYSEWFYVNDGMLIGFRFYGSCNSVEKNSNPPMHKGRFEVNEICGSIFFDINAYAEPNKLGSDQYVLPVYKRGIKYNNDN